MKRGRDHTLEDDDINPPNRSAFRFSPDTTCSNTNVSSPPNATAHTNNNNKEQDRFLPIANVGRIMKKVIPGNGKISKDAKETVQECVSEFISFVTGEASDKCQREKRKTINGDDILWAIMTLGFEDYVNPLKIYLTKYREIEGEKLNVPKQQQRVEQCLPHEQATLTPYCNIYPPANLIGQTPFVAAEPPPFSLPYPKTSMPAAGLPQQDPHVDEHW